jgi:alpha-tubulin suppressor-like RCC1 family protein
MPTGINKIIDNVNSKTAAGGLTELQIAQINGIITSLDTGDVISVANCAALPAACLSTGRLIYVDSMSSYRYSDGTQWTTCYDTNLVYGCQLWSWGAGSFGRLGIGTTSNMCSPVREISSAGNWKHLGGGYYTGTAIKADGSLWTWGRNNNGQLGIGVTTCMCSPVREISSSTTWCKVCGAISRTAGIKTDGTLWSWGDNVGTYGGLGDGTGTSRCSPVREKCSATNWTCVSLGKTHTIALKSTGEIWVWGGGYYGSLGAGAQKCSCSPVREICSATNWCTTSTSLGENSFAIKTDGTLWGWGKGNNSSVWRTNSCSATQEASGSTTWASVNAGFFNSVALKTDGSLWSWGCAGNYGSLGDGLKTSTSSPVREFCSATNWCKGTAGAGHSAAIKTDGTMWTWGCGNQGSLMNGLASSGRCSPVQEYTSATNWTDVKLGNGAGLALKVAALGGF